MADGDIDIRNIDLTQYQSAPMLPIDALLQLISDLDRAKPANAPDFVLRSAATMKKTAAEIESRLSTRIGEAGTNTRAEVDFDIETDKCWIDGRTELARRMRDKSPALNQLSPAAQQRLDLDHRREMAGVAEELDAHLFAIDGTEFLRLPFAEQVVQMARRLAFIHSSPRAALYKEVLGDGVLDKLDEMQIRYEEMVHSRATRITGLNNIRTLRHDAQRQIAMYASTVLATMDEADKQTVRIAIDALTPIRNARAKRPSSSTGSSAGVPAAVEQSDGEPTPESS